MSMDVDWSRYACNCGSTTKDHLATCPLWFYPWAWAARERRRVPTPEAE